VCLGLLIPGVLAADPDNPSALRQGARAAGALGNPALLEKFKERLRGLDGADGVPRTESEDR
jgi:hypothetical protein